MRFGEIAGIAVAVVVLVIALLMATGPGEHESPTQETPPVKIPAMDLPVVDFKGDIVETDGPVSYYMNKCARCHGPADNAYAEFAAPRRGQDLKHWINIMAEGPAIAPLDAAGLELQFRLHTAMLDMAPYAWIDDSKKEALAGETIDGTTIYLRTATERLRATITDQKFILPRQPGTLIAERNGKTIEIPVTK